MRVVFFSALYGSPFSTSTPINVCVKEAVVNAMSLSISDAWFPPAVGPCQGMKDFFSCDVQNVAYKNALMRQLDG